MTTARFQTFEDTTDRAAVAGRVAALRAKLAQQELSGFVISRADRHQNEYVAPCDERLAWLTGFSGSAGLAIVLAEKAALFVDGRYTLQGAEQTDTAVFEVVPIADTTPEVWLTANLPSGAALGYDPWLHTAEGAERLAKACESVNARLVPVTSNPVDAIWNERPAPPLGRVVLHDLKFSGEPAEAKLERIRAELKKLKANMLVVTDPHAVAWTFNIRGSDVAHTPLVLAFAIVPAEGRPTLFVDTRKLDNGVRYPIEKLADVREPDAFDSALAALGYARNIVRLDSATAADAVQRIIVEAGGKPARGVDPIAAMKAVKNAAEITGTRTAHLRDGAAVSRFLAWLAREAPSGNLSEIETVEALENFRRDTGALKDVSFPTISGSGPNGAIVHYRVTEKSNRKVAPGELFLVDSGAQYEDGTTDITRTVAVGEPTKEMRDRFTRVLKGHIAIARAVFPDGTTGAQLDSFARAPLWSAGLDFDHGTGHGVGSYLSVHEGPARISKLGAAALKRGMILSNEPGYYKAGSYGIRIENLVLVIEAPNVAGGERPLNAFETLTLAPIDRSLIMPAMLDPGETGWLDSYHARVRAALTPLVDSTTKAWLEMATRPLADG
jgi:Xaa-Pro aminopeptidase